GSAWFVVSLILDGDAVRRMTSVWSVARTASSPPPWLRLLTHVRFLSGRRGTAERLCGGQRRLLPGGDDPYFSPARAAADQREFPCPGHTRQHRALHDQVLAGLWL